MKYNVADVYWWRAGARGGRWMPVTRAPGETRETTLEDLRRMGYVARAGTWPPTGEPTAEEIARLPQSQGLGGVSGKDKKG